MKENKGTSSGIYIIAITAFFLGCFLLLVLFGTNIYRNIAGRQAANNDQRAILSYLLTTTKMNETRITERQDDKFGELLVVEDAGTGYGNRIYVNEGYLVEDYGKVEGPLMPDYAIRIGETDTLEIEKVNEKLMKVTTDEGSVFIHLRAQGDN